MTPNKSFHLIQLICRIWNIWKKKKKGSVCIDTSTMKKPSSEYNSRENKRVQQLEVDISKPDSVNVHQAGLNWSK